MVLRAFIFCLFAVASSVEGADDSYGTLNCGSKTSVTLRSEVHCVSKRRKTVGPKIMLCCFR
jgi:hypothetical protein